MNGILVDGKFYFILERLSVHQCGLPAAVVLERTEERIAVKRGGRTWWTPKDRLQKGTVCTGQ